MSFQSQTSIQLSPTLETMESKSPQPIATSANSQSIRHCSLAHDSPRAASTSITTTTTSNSRFLYSECECRLPQSHRQRFRHRSTTGTSTTTTLAKRYRIKDTKPSEMNSKTTTPAKPFASAERDIQLQTIQPKQQPQTACRQEVRLEDWDRVEVDNAGNAAVDRHGAMRHPCNSHDPDGSFGKSTGHD